ncbi:MAG: arylmalonate decarboxylase [Microbacteriaceae bacterium]
MPSTNTVVEHDYAAMKVPGVTSHFGRIYIPDGAAGDNDAFEHLISQIRAATSDAVKQVMTCKPDYMVMGMSAETFWGGKAGNEAFTRRMKDLCGLAVSTGADACHNAAKLLRIQRIAVITPYQPVADRQVEIFFSESGLDVRRIKGLKCASATAIAEVPEDRLIRELQEIDGDDVDAIVQVGTNLSMLRVAAEAERWLAKPVLAINAVTMWHALRANGINDQLVGFGQLLEQH